MRAQVIDGTGLRVGDGDFEDLGGCPWDCGEPAGSLGGSSREAERKASRWSGDDPLDELLDAYLRHGGVCGWARVDSAAAAV